MLRKLICHFLCLLALAGTFALLSAGLAACAAQSHAPTITPTLTLAPTKTATPTSTPTPTVEAQGEVCPADVPVGAIVAESGIVQDAYRADPLVTEGPVKEYLGGPVALQELKTAVLNMAYAADAGGAHRLALPAFMVKEVSELRRGGIDAVFYDTPDYRPGEGRYKLEVWWFEEKAGGGYVFLFRGADGLLRLPLASGETTFGAWQLWPEGAVDLWVLKAQMAFGEPLLVRFGGCTAFVQVGADGKPTAVWNPGGDMMDVNSLWETANGDVLPQVPPDAGEGVVYDFEEQAWVEPAAPEVRAAVNDLKLEAGNYELGANEFWPGREVLVNKDTGEWAGINIEGEWFKLVFMKEKDPAMPYEPIMFNRGPSFSGLEEKPKDDGSLTRNRTFMRAFVDRFFKITGSNGHEFYLADVSVPAESGEGRSKLRIFLGQGHDDIGFCTDGKGIGINRSADCFEDVKPGDLVKNILPGRMAVFDIIFKVNEWSGHKNIYYFADKNPIGIGLYIVVMQKGEVERVIKELLSGGAVDDLSVWMPVHQVNIGRDY